jgi:hypothetical protein
MSQGGGGHIQFPSPAELLRPDLPIAAEVAESSTGPTHASAKLKTPARTKDTLAKSKAKVSKAQAEGTLKPKQSKSRNGE